MSDTISRQAAIDEIKALYEWHEIVTEDRAIDHFKRLPSAEPEPKTGEWIYAKEQLEIVPMWECSCCRIRMPKKFNYCPNCGSYNGGDQSETD